VPEPDARTERLDAVTARWLVDDAGRDAIARARDGLDGGRGELAVVSDLRSLGLDPGRTAAVVSAAHAAGRIPAGLAQRGELVFTRAALEQASDPDVATWRARRFADRVVADVGCGAGSDLLALADSARVVVGIDRDPARAVLARHNVGSAGSDAHVVVGDGLALPVRAQAVHADPSRRFGGRRARSLAGYDPPVARLLSATSATAVGIVVSPAVSWSDPDLPPDAEVEFVQRGWDLVEGMLWLGGVRRSGARATATLLSSGGDPVTRSRTSAAGIADELPTGDVGSVLLEIAPAAVRARLHDSIGVEVGAWRLARTRALLTADSPPPPSPWFRTWHVEASLPARPRAVRAWLRTAEAQPLEIATSGFDADPDAWWRELGRPPRGPQGRRLLLVRLDKGGTALVLARSN